MSPNLPIMNVPTATMARIEAISMDDSATRDGILQLQRCYPQVERGLLLDVLESSDGDESVCMVALFEMFGVAQVSSNDQELPDGRLIVHFLTGTFRGFYQGFASNRPEGFWKHAPPAICETLFLFGLVHCIGE